MTKCPCCEQNIKILEYDDALHRLTIQCTGCGLTLRGKVVFVDDVAAVVKEFFVEAKSLCSFDDFEGDEVCSEAFEAAVECEKIFGNS